MAGACWPFRFALAMIAGAGLAFVTLLLRTATYDGPTAERFQVLDVVGDGTASRHAVVYRHDRAGSGTSQTGVWIVEGMAPDKGARDRPHGEPAAIWAGGMPRLGWQGGSLRLVTEVAGTLARPSGAITGCLDGTAHPSKPRLCYDASRVTLVPLPR